MPTLEYLEAVGEEVDWYMDAEENTVVVYRYNGQLYKCYYHPDADARMVEPVTQEEC